MGFKLVRVDTTEPCKVPLPLGSHLIGRGKFLECNDHRVSRKHAELIVTSDSVLLKSLHQNPCFIKEKSSKETIIFCQPDSRILSNGDQFGLIPDSYWYELINYLEDSTDYTESVKPNEKTSIEETAITEGENALTEDMNSDTEPYENNQEIINFFSESFIDDRSESPSLIPPDNPSSPTKEPEGGSETPLAGNPEDMDTSANQVDKSTDISAESMNQPVESNNQAVESTNQPVESTNQAVESTNQPVESTNQAVESTNQAVESVDQPFGSTDQVVTASKRSHSQESCPYEVKRVKTEPEESPSKESEGLTKTNSHNNSSSDDNAPDPDQPVKTEPGCSQDVKAGPSNDQGGSSNDGNNNAPPSPVKPPNKPLRERCMYGANCYRRNPHHKATFSHPADADWGGGARAPCPWGAACRRADPRHWRDHDHPHGVHQPPPRPQGNRPGIQVRRYGNSLSITAHTVNIYYDHYEAEDSDGDSVDYDYEF